MTPASDNPRSSARPSAGSRPVTTLTLLYGGIIIVRILLYAGRYLAPEALQPAVDKANWAQVALLVGGVIVGVTWLEKAWTRVPEPARLTYDKRRVAPATAVSRLFIPLYGLYWMFIANVGLCGAIENHARRRGTERRAPSTAAMVACIAQITPYVGFFFGPLFWLPFMIKVDRAQRELED
jgi:hypothetical protein